MTNTVLLVGNLGADPETRSTRGDTKITNFSLGTSRPKRDGEGKVLKDPTRSTIRNAAFLQGTIWPLTDLYIRRVSKPRQNWTDQVLNCPQSNSLHRSSKQQIRQDVVTFRAVVGQTKLAKAWALAVVSNGSEKNWQGLVW